MLASVFCWRAQPEREVESRILWRPLSPSNYFPAQNWCFGKSGQGRAATQDPPGATGGGFTEPDGEGGRIYRAARFSIARPMVMRLSAMPPRPTQRFIPASPL